MPLVVVAEVMDGLAEAALQNEAVAFIREVADEFADHRPAQAWITGVEGGLVFHHEDSFAGGDDAIRESEGDTTIESKAIHVQRGRSHVPELEILEVLVHICATKGGRQRMIHDLRHHQPGPLHDVGGNGRRAPGRTDPRTGKDTGIGIEGNGRGIGKRTSRHRAVGPDGTRVGAVERVIDRATWRRSHDQSRSSGDVTFRQIQKRAPGKLAVDPKVAAVGPLLHLRDDEIISRLAVVHIKSSPGTLRVGPNIGVIQNRILGVVADGGFREQRRDFINSVGETGAVHDIRPKHTPAVGDLLDEVRIALCRVGNRLVANQSAEPDVGVGIVEHRIVPLAGVTTVEVVRVAEGEVPIPYRRVLYLAVAILVEKVTDAIAVNLFGELDNPV